MSKGFKAGDIIEVRETAGSTASGDRRFDEDPFEDSMAAAIEEAFEEVWKAVHGSNVPEEGKWERRILFVAVARGVLGYLQGHLREEGGEGFSVSVTQKEEQRIVSSGTTEGPISDPAGGHTHHIEVTQDDEDGDNRVVCSDVEIHVRDVGGSDG